MCMYFSLVVDPKRMRPPVHSLSGRPYYHSLVLGALVIKSEMPSSSIDGCTSSLTKLVFELNAPLKMTQVPQLALCLSGWLVKENLPQASSARKASAMPCKSYGALEGDRESAVRRREGGRPVGRTAVIFERGGVRRTQVGRCSVMCSSQRSRLRGGDRRTA